MPADWLRAELHCHTVWSHDGHIRFDGLLRTARRRGLDVVAVTDHDTIAGALEFRKRARSRNEDLAIIVGEERTLGDGSHVIGLFLEEPLSGTSLDAVRDEIASQGGLCVLPHPFRGDGVLAKGAVAHADDLIEIFNPKCDRAQNARAAEQVHAETPVVGGSDAHYESDLGECVNVVAWAGTVKQSVAAAARGLAPIRVEGVVQAEGGGRRYAAWYYDHRGRFRIPRALKPLVRRAYRQYRNRLARRRAPVLETKFARLETPD